MARRAMRESGARAILVVLAIQLLLAGASAAPMASDVNPMGNHLKMDAALENALAQGEESNLEVIFQLTSTVKESDLTRLADFGATVLGDAPLINGGLLSASPDDIRIISNWERVEYLELNRQLEFFYLP